MYSLMTPVFLTRILICLVPQKALVPSRTPPSILTFRVLSFERCSQFQYVFVKSTFANPEGRCPACLSHALKPELKDVRLFMKISLLLLAMFMFITSSDIFFCTELLRCFIYSCLTCFPLKSEVANFYSASHTQILMLAPELLRPFCIEIVS